MLLPAISISEFSFWWTRSHENEFHVIPRIAIAIVIFLKSASRQNQELDLFQTMEITVKHRNYHKLDHLSRHHSLLGAQLIEKAADETNDFTTYVIYN